MARSILFLFVLAGLCLLSNVRLSSAHSQEGSGGQMHPQKCSKILTRKEWRMLTESEKAEWLAAVKCLASIQHQRLSLAEGQTVLEGKRSLYDDFSYSHAFVEHSAHRNAYFLPWHRWYTHLFDTSLRDICAYTGPTPYWDWTLDHADLFSSPVFDDSPVYGLGGTGDCGGSSDCAVTTGAFAPSADSSSSGSSRNFELAWPIPHTLRRNLTLITGWFAHERPQNRTLTPEYVRNSIERTTGDFFSFQSAMAGLHNHVHNFVGGDLAGDCPGALSDADCQGLALSFTPNDPLFWLHHAQLDRLWSEWQHHHPTNYDAFSGMPLVPHNMSDPRYDRYAHADHQMPFDIHSVPVAPRAVFDTKVWPLCYRYAEQEGRPLDEN